MFKKVVMVAIVLVLFGAAYYYLNPANLDVPLTSIDTSFEQVTLPNGLTVSIKELPNTPLVTIQFWIHVGSRNEPEQFRGIAHIFEHIWFKGTKNQPVGSFHKRVESLGGELNAMTSHDWTMYYVTLPADKFDDIFPLMVDLLLNPLFNETEIEKEKEVVTEEQRFSYNEPVKFVDDQFAQLLIQEHPYRHPIIGYKDTILAPSKEDIAQFYRTWYVPNNMNIVVAGNVNAKDVLSDVTAAFLELDSAIIPSRSHLRETPPAVPRYNSSEREVGFNYVSMGYYAPAAADPDRYAMEVLNAIISKGENSKLQLLEQNNVITQGLAGYTPLNDLGVIEIIATIDPQKTAQAKAELIMMLTALRTRTASDDDLKRAKALLLADYARSQEEVFNIGFAIGQSWVHNTPEYQEYVARINAVTAQDVQNVAQKYFAAYTMFELKPEP